MLNVGNDTLTALFTGAMGIKSAYVGGVLIYQRPGGYIYLNLQKG